MINETGTMTVGSQAMGVLFFFYSQGNPAARIIKKAGTD
jgi:hypothetical protein